MFRIGLGDTCPHCGSFAVFRSRPETRLAKALELFLFDIARCHGCMRQHYRPLAFPAPEFPGPATNEDGQAEIDG